MLRIASHRQLHASAVACHARLTALRCSSAFSGKATKRGTGQFLIDNKVTLCHLLKKTDLYVNVSMLSLAGYLCVPLGSRLNWLACGLLQCVVHGGARFKQRTVDPATALIFVSSSTLDVHWTV
jgi:hypothetical protein